MSKNLKKQNDLISCLKNGEEDAYVFLVKTYNKLLFSYAISLTNDRAMAEDIVQDVFFGIWKDRKKLNTSYSLKNFLFKITYNKFINQYHKNRAISSLERAYMESLNEIVDERNSELLKKKIELVTEGIANLPKKCKETFLLSKKEGLTNIEIAEYLDISVKTVEGHLTKAYKLLRKNIGNQIENILFIMFGCPRKV
jgi:RNA polymerase sigma-70 factor (ECF subfamily)